MKTGFHRQRDFLDMTWWDPYVETIADEDTYLRRKFRQDVTDKTTGLPQDALHGRLAEIVAAGKAAGEDWRVTKAKCFAAEVNEQSIDVSPLDWFPAIAIWDRLNLPIAKVCKRDRAAEINAARLPDWVKKEWAAGNADGSWNVWQDFDHSVPDWRVILPLGFPGMRARLEQIARKAGCGDDAPSSQSGCEAGCGDDAPSSQSGCEAGCGDDAPSSHPVNDDGGVVATSAFYESCFIAADALLAGIDRFIEQAKKNLELFTNDNCHNCSQITNTISTRSARLKKEIACLERLRSGAPQTAYDMLMFVWIYFMFSEHLDGIQCRSLTELDVFLTPYYDADIAAGRTTEAEFREQLKHFLWQWGSIANYWNQPVGLGGTKPDGTSEFNHVSKIILDVMDECALTTPKFLVKVAPNTPDWAWDKMLDMARRHRSIAFIGEEPTARALKKWTGASDQDCREMVVRGCYEFALRDGCNSTGVGHVNFLKIVEKMLAEAASCGGDAPSSQSRRDACCGDDAPSSQSRRDAGCGDDAPSSQSRRDAGCGDDAPSSQSSISDDGGVVATAKSPLQGPFFPGSDGLAHANLTITKGNALPHWAANGVVYHICFRLADSVPQAKLREWEEARENLRRRLKDGEPLSENAMRELKNLQAATVEKYLDSGYGECLLSNRNVADILVAALMHDDGRQYLIHAYGIMPNHVHVLVEFPDSNDMGNAVRAWKSVSGHRTNKLLVRSGAVWQTDYYNHIIRTSKEYLHQKEYIFSNNMVASWKRDFRCGDDASSSQSSISDDGGVLATTAAGRDDGGVVATTTGWPSFLAEYLRRLAETTDRCRTVTFELEKVLPDVNPANLMTLATEHALRTRRDGFANGCPRGNNTAILSVGLGTAVDALLAVKELVFEKKEFTLAQLGSIMAANWEGHEALRLRMLRSKRKWGNNDPEANALGKELIECYSSQINGKPNSRGGVFVASGHCARQFIVLGEKTGATPDGRKAGEEMSKNLSPTMGADTEGATALVLTLASSDVEHLPGDYPLDMMLHPSVCAGEGGLAVMRTLVQLFHKNGGSVIQFTVFSPEELRDAQAHPEKYENLQVRVCGWNVRWNDLARPEQDAYIRRAENVAQT